MSIYDEMLPMWTHPTGFDSNANFVGTQPTGYVIYSRNRESSILENVNFYDILTDLGGEGEHVTIVRHGHWACGWIEYLIVDRNAAHALLDRCVDIARALANYPIFNEESYSDAQYEAIYNYWNDVSLSDRIDLCRKNKVSIFAARRDHVPTSVYDALQTSIY